MDLDVTQLFTANAHWGRWFKARLKELGLTQKDIAGKLSVEPKTVSRWARSKHFPRMHNSAAQNLGRLIDVHDDLLPYGHLVNAATASANTDAA